VVAGSLPGRLYDNSGALITYVRGELLIPLGDDYPPPEIDDHSNFFFFPVVGIVINILPHCREKTPEVGFRSGGEKPLSSQE